MEEKKIKKHKKSDSYDKFVDEVAKDLIMKNKEREEEEDEYAGLPTQSSKKHRKTESYDKFVEEVAKDLIKNKKIEKKKNIFTTKKLMMKLKRNLITLKIY